MDGTTTATPTRNAASNQVGETVTMGPFGSNQIRNAGTTVRGGHHQKSQRRETPTMEMEEGIRLVLHHPRLCRRCNPTTIVSAHTAARLEIVSWKQRGFPASSQYIKTGEDGQPNSFQVIETEEQILTVQGTILRSVVDSFRSGNNFPVTYQ